MEPGGVGMGLLCIAVLCSGAALILGEEEPRHQSTTQRDDVLKPRSQSTVQRDNIPTTIAEDEDELTTRSTVTPTTLGTGDPITTPMLTQAGATGNKTQNASAVPIRYWSPVIFVVVALLVLFFTYRRTKGEGTQDHVTPDSDSSDLGALDHVPIHDTTPIIPTPQEERKGPERPPALEHTETTFCQPAPPPPQPDTPGGPRCSGEPGAD